MINEWEFPNNNEKLFVKKIVRFTILTKATMEFKLFDRMENILNNPSKYIFNKNKNVIKKGWNDNSEWNYINLVYSFFFLSNIFFFFSFFA